MRLSDRNRPGSHIHMSTVPEWMGDVVFRGHLRQESREGAAGSGENVFATQSVHTEACCEEYDPALHGMHAEMLEAPVMADAVPAGHFLQIWPPSERRSE